MPQKIDPYLIIDRLRRELKYIKENRGVVLRVCIDWQHPNRQFRETTDIDLLSTKAGIIK